MRKTEEPLSASRSLLALVTPKAHPPGSNFTLEQLFANADRSAFDPMTYKTRPCTNPDCHDHLCLFYHSPQDRRRNVTQYRYKCKACRCVKLGNLWDSPSACRFGDKCSFAHTFYELKYHPHVYKTSECTDKDCTRGAICWNKHESTAPKEEPSVTAVVGLYSDTVQQCKGLKASLVEANSRLVRAEEQLRLCKEKLGCCLCKRGGIAAALVPCGDVFCAACLTSPVPRCPFCLRASESKLLLHLNAT